MRFCIICWTEIHECMGFCLARDIIRLIHGETTHVREICGLCILMFDDALMEHPMKFLPERDD